MIDWFIVGAIFIFITFVAIRSAKKTKSVSDFLVANRCAGRYLLSVAEGEASMGAITILWMWENWTQTGWTQFYWRDMSMPIATFMTITGWLVYRFRATRAMTLAQFFEMRYSRRFRIFAGLLTWFSGVLNFGIFPAVAGRFFISWFGMENYFVQVGPVNLNLTLGAVMLFLVGVALFFTFIGGLVTVLVTDFWQGLIAMAIFIACLIFILYSVGWDRLSEGLQIASAPGKSLYDPFDIADKPDFGMGFFLIGWFFLLYNRISFQGTQQYNCSALNPHEAKMSKALAAFRGLAVGLGLSLMPMAALAVMHHPEFTDIATNVKQYLVESFPDNENYQRQMMVPTALRNILPVGLTGLFASAMLGFFISTNNSYMHSFGSIFVQDVLIPLRKKPLSQERHVMFLRISIIFVAMFVFFFSWLFPMKDYIYMFLQITGAVFVGGAGTVIIGGLYWKRGTTAAAWTAMIVGGTLAMTSIIIRQAWPHLPLLVERYGEKFPINGQVMTFISAVSAMVVYVVISLLQWKPAIDMDKLLHRGKYASRKEEQVLKERGAEQKPISRFWKIIGVNSHEFSKADKGLFLLVWVYMGVYGMLRLVVLGILRFKGILVGTDWLRWWHYVVFELLVLSIIFSIWIAIGGLLDLRRLRKELDSEIIKEEDDGRVKSEEHLARDDNDNA